MTAFDGTLIAVLTTFIAGVLGVAITGVRLVNLPLVVSVIILIITFIVIAAHYYGWKSDIFKIRDKTRKKIPKLILTIFVAAAIFTFIFANTKEKKTPPENSSTTELSSIEDLTEPAANKAVTENDNTEGHTSEPTDTTVKIGDIVSFGEYYQNKGEEKEPIKWLVLDIQDTSMLVISQKLLDCKQFNEDSNDNFWNTSTIRRWLRYEFADTAFSSEIQQKIIPTYMDSDTEDTIFLLSTEEAEFYFNNAKAREAVPTAYAITHNAGRDKELSGGPGWWWLRSPGTNVGCVADIRSGGAINYEGYGVKSKTFSVRPALWIDITVLKTGSE